MREIWRTLYGAFFLLILGCVVGLAANGARGRGQINLFHSYMPSMTPAPRPAPATQTATDPQAASEPGHGSTAQPDGALDAPYTLLGFDEVKAIYEDEARVGMLDVFFDARDSAPYRRSHIPTAVQFFPYDSGFFANVALQYLGAERIIIYCNGGQCEDSILAAQELERLGFLRAQLHIYKGGWEEWHAAGMPLTEGL